MPLGAGTQVVAPACPAVAEPCRPFWRGHLQVPSVSAQDSTLLLKFFFPVFFPFLVLSYTLLFGTQSTPPLFQMLKFDIFILQLTHKET